MDDSHIKTADSTFSKKTLLIISSLILLGTFLVFSMNNRIGQLGIGYPSGLLLAAYNATINMSTINGHKEHGIFTNQGHTKFMTTDTENSNSSITISLSSSNMSTTVFPMTTSNIKSQFLNSLKTVFADESYNTKTGMAAVLYSMCKA